MARQLDLANYGPCLAKIAAKGRITSTQAQQILQEVHSRAEAWREKGVADPFVTAVGEMAARLKNNARSDTIDAVENASKFNVLMKKIKDNLVNAGTEIRSFLNGEYEGTLNSIQTHWHAWAKPKIRALITEAEGLFPAKVLTSRELDIDTAKEMDAIRNGKESVTGNSKIRQLAELYVRLQNIGRDYINTNGGRVGDANDFIAHLSHDRDRIRRAAGSAADNHDDAFKAWWDFAKPRLSDDTFKNVIPRGEETQDEANDRFGRSFFDAVLSGKHMTPEGALGFETDANGFVPPRFEGTANLARRLSQPRVFIFKDPESFIEYQQRFGVGNSLYEQVGRGLIQASRFGALMKFLGTNPKAMLNRIVDATEKEFRDMATADPRGGWLNKLEDFRRDIAGNIYTLRPKVEDIMNFLDGTNDVPSHDRVASWGGNVRSLLSTAMLGGVGLTHFASIWPTVMSEMVHHGYTGFGGRMEVLGRLVYSMAHTYANTPEELRQFLDETGAYSGGLSRHLSHYNPDSTVPGYISTIAAAHMKWTGIHYLFDHAQAAIHDLLSNGLGRNVDKEFGNLEPHLTQMLTKYGLGQREWDLIRSVEPGKWEDRAYTVPSDAQKISNDKLDAYNSDKIAALRQDLADREDRYAARDAKEMEWQQKRAQATSDKIASLKKWVEGKAVGRNVKLGQFYQTAADRVEALQARIHLAEVKTDIFGGLRGMNTQAKVREFLNKVEDGADAERVANQSNNTIEQEARRNLSAGERLGVDRTRAEKAISDVEKRTGAKAKELTGKNAEDAAYLEQRIKEINNDLAEADGRMSVRMAARAEDLERIENEDIPAAIEEMRQRTKDDIADKIMGYFSDGARHGVVTAGVREKALLLGNAKPGDKGDWARYFAQYKMWPVAAVHQIAMREAYMSLDKSDLARNIFAIATIGALSGYFRMSVNDAAVGRPLRNPLDPRTLLAAIAQSGGLGIFGDFLFGEQSRMGVDFGATVMGPGFSQLASIWKVYSDWQQGKGGVMDMAHLLSRNVPFANLVYAKGAFDYLLWYHLFEAASPGWWERTNRRLEKEQGRTMTGFMPGEGVPFGVPPFYMRNTEGRTFGLFGQQ